MKKSKFSEIVISIATLIIGVCLLVWAEQVTNLASQVFGCVMILYGIFTAISYFRSEDRKVVDIIYAILLIVVGLILAFKPEIVTETISFVIGIYVVLASITSIRLALENKDSDNYKLALGLSIAGIIIGVLCIVGKLLIPNIALQFIGLMLVIYSVINIINSIIIIKK